MTRGVTLVSFWRDVDTRINGGDPYGYARRDEKYLPKLVSGELVAAYALSEASSGSDALGGRTKAVLSPDGKHWILNRSKQWISNAGFADVFIVFAKIDGNAFSAFVVEKGTPGFTVGPEEHKMGIRGSSTLDEDAADVTGYRETIVARTLDAGQYPLGWS